MDNDLISREDLKKELEEIISDKPISIFKDGIVRALKAIDNAPAANIEDQIAGAYNEGYMCGNKEAEKERPQGEWNYIQAGMCVCPFCGAMPHKLYKNYCANCGADMKGGAE